MDPRRHPGASISPFDRCLGVVVKDDGGRCSVWLSLCLCLRLYRLFASPANPSFAFFSNSAQMRLNSLCAIEVLIESGSETWHK